LRERERGRTEDGEMEGGVIDEAEERYREIERDRERERERERERSRGRELERKGGREGGRWERETMFLYVGWAAWVCWVRKSWKNEGSRDRERERGRSGSEREREEREIGYVLWAVWVCWVAVWEREGGETGVEEIEREGRERETGPRESEGERVRRRIERSWRKRRRIEQRRGRERGKAKGWEREGEEARGRESEDNLVMLGEEKSRNEGRRNLEIERFEGRREIMNGTQHTYLLNLCNFLRITTVATTSVYRFGQVQLWLTDTNMQLFIDEWPEWLTLQSERDSSLHLGPKFIVSWSQE
jgi:hypothetical protein